MQFKTPALSAQRWRLTCCCSADFRHDLARMSRTTIVAIKPNAMVMMASPMFWSFRLMLVGGPPVMRMTVMVFGGKIGVIVPVMMIARKCKALNREQGDSDDPVCDDFFHAVSPRDVGMIPCS
jgi:hypothetical protein